MKGANNETERNEDTTWHIDTDAHAGADADPGTVAAERSRRDGIRALCRRYMGNIGECR